MGGQEFSDRAAPQFAGRHASAICKPVSKGVAATGCCLVMIQVAPIIVMLTSGIEKLFLLKIIKYASLSITIICAIIALVMHKRISIKSNWFLMWTSTWATWILGTSFRFNNNGVFEIPDHIPSGFIILIFGIMRTFSIYDGVLTDDVGNAASTPGRTRATKTGLLAFFFSNMAALGLAFPDPANAVFFFSTAMVLSVTIFAYQLGYELLAAEVK